MYLDWFQWIIGVSQWAKSGKNCNLKCVFGWLHHQLKAYYVKHFSKTIILAFAKLWDKPCIVLPKFFPCFSSLYVRSNLIWNWIAVCNVHMCLIASDYKKKIEATFALLNPLKSTMKWPATDKSCRFRQISKAARNQIQIKRWPHLSTFAEMKSLLKSIQFTQR